MQVAPDGPAQLDGSGGAGGVPVAVLAASGRPNRRRWTYWRWPSQRADRARADRHRPARPTGSGTGRPTSSGASRLARAPGGPTGRVGVAPRFIGRCRSSGSSGRPAGTSVGPPSSGRPTSSWSSSREFGPDDAGSSPRCRVLRGRKPCGTSTDSPGWRGPFTTAIRTRRAAQARVVLVLSLVVAGVPRGRLRAAVTMRARPIAASGPVRARRIRVTGAQPRRIARQYRARMSRGCRTGLDLMPCSTVRSAPNCGRSTKPTGGASSREHLVAAGLAIDTDPKRRLRTRARLAVVRPASLRCVRRWASPRITRRSGPRPSPSFAPRVESRAIPATLP